MNMKEINNTIYELENGETTHASCQKLAALYIVKDHIEGQDPDKEIINDIPKVSDSEFMQKAISSDPTNLWSTLDEGMTTLSALNPKLYSVIINKL